MTLSESLNIKARSTGSWLTCFKLLAILSLITIPISLVATSLTYASPSCRIPTDQEWTPQEQWAWKNLCAGEIVDFNAGKAYGGKLDPKKPELWPKSRVLRSSFLKTILNQGRFLDAIPAQKIHIIGARFVSLVSLSDSSVLSRGALLLERCRFENAIELSLFHSITVSLKDSVVVGILNMDAMHVSYAFLDGVTVTDKSRMNGIKADGLFMRRGQFQDEVDLRAARIERQLSMRESTFTGKLNMDLVTIGGSLLMRDGSRFTDIVLTNARIEGDLELTDAKITGKLNMSSIRVGGSIWGDKVETHEVDLNRGTIEGMLYLNEAKMDNLYMSGLHAGSLFMREGAEVKDVDLTGAKVDNQLVLDETKILGTLGMDSLHVGSSLLLRDLQIVPTNEINLAYADIGSVLDISGSDLPSLDLTGTKVHGEFRLGSPGNGLLTWKPGSRLTLRNAAIGVLQDDPMVWPESLDLDGFIYQTFPLTAVHDTSWFIKWLAKQQPYASQPYEQLASALQKAGRRDIADALIYQSKERERTEEAGGLAWIKLSLLKIFIGYGVYTVSYSIVWVMIFTLLGWRMLCLSHDNPFRNIYITPSPVLPKSLSRILPSTITSGLDTHLAMIAFSFDRFLPIVKLREAHYSKIDLGGWVAYYFYFHQLMGYLLASLLIGGLTGLTVKK